MVDASNLQRDQKLGGRIRRNWNKIVAEGKKFGLNAAQMRDAVKGGALSGTDATRKALAKQLGLTPDEWAELFATILPMILEMMAACG